MIKKIKPFEYTDKENSIRMFVMESFKFLSITPVSPVQYY